MGVILFILYIIISFSYICRKKSFFSITLIYLVIAPNLKFGSSSIDAMYFLIIYLIGIMIISKKKPKLLKRYVPYVALIVFNFVIYFIMTLVKNNNITSEGLSCIIGFLKIPFLLILITNMFFDELTDNIKYDKAFKSVVLINFIGVLMQFVLGAKIRTFFEEMYLTDSYRYYSALSNAMVYNRKFGFFGSPMLLGAFSSFSLIYFLCRYSITQKNEHIAYILISLINGVTSLSKTFFIGVPLIILLFVFFGIIEKGGRLKITKKFIRGCVICILFIPIVIYAYNFMAENSTIEYYVKMLANPFKALNTRYSNENEDILLSKTYKIIEDNYFIGVGFQSLNGEFLGDSTYVLALHHGGLMSLISIIIFYLMQCVDSLVITKEFTRGIFFMFWAVSGLGMNNLFNVIMIIPFVIYFMRGDTRIEKNTKIYEKS